MLLRDVEHRCSVSKLVTLYRSQQLPSCALFRVDKVGMHDYFTRWVETYAISNQEAVTVADKLVEEFFGSVFHARTAALGSRAPI